MRKRTLVIVGLPAVGLACVIALSLRRPTEPTYAGETLTQWVKRYKQTGSSEGAQKAIRTMVSTSLPQIAQLANYDPTSRRMRRERLILKLPAPIRNSRLLLPLWNLASAKDPILFRDNRDKNASAAFDAICIAGPAATNAVPMLLDLVRTNGPACSQRAVHALGLITLDTLTVPILTNLAINPLVGPNRRRLAILDLKWYTNDPAAFAFLTNALKHPDRQTQAAAAEALAPLLYQ